MKNKIQTFLVVLMITLCVILICILSFLFINQKKNKSRTIMIYMVGADLETKQGLATIDLNGIDYNKMDNKNVNVVLFAGGTKKWHNDYIDENETSIFEFGESGFKKVKTNKRKNMGSSKVFSDFLNYVYDNYKTDEYDLIFWDHGGGIYGSAFDELSKDVLSLHDMKIGLANSKFKKKKFETVIFRTCLNGTIEVSNIFKDYSKYIVASEEVTIGTTFTSVLKFINDIETKDSAYDINYKFIESYKSLIKKYRKELNRKKNNNEVYSTYSIVNLSKINNLTKSVNDFFKDIDLTNNYNKISRVRDNLHQYATVSSSMKDYDTVDLYNLVDNLKELSPSKAKTVLSNLEKSVEYNWATDNKSRGISIYFPYNGKEKAIKEFLLIYSSFNFLNEYNDFINSFNLMLHNSPVKYTYSSNNININTNNKNDSDFTLELTDKQKESFSKAKYIVFRDTKDGYYQPIYIGQDVKMENNLLKANIKDRQLKIVDKHDNKSEIITLVESDNNDNNIKYTTSVILQNFNNMNDYKIENAQMNLSLNKKNKQIDIDSIILKNNEEKLVNSIAVVLNDFKTIAFGSYRYKVKNKDGSYNNNWQSNGIYNGVEVNIKNVEFTVSELDDNYDYYAVFLIQDVNKNEYYSKLIKID